MKLLVVYAILLFYIFRISKATNDCVFCNIDKINNANRPVNKEEAIKIKRDTVNVKQNQEDTNRSDCRLCDIVNAPKKKIQNVDGEIPDQIQTQKVKREIKRLETKPERVRRHPTRDPSADPFGFDLNLDDYAMRESHDPSDYQQSSNRNCDEIVSRSLQDVMRSPLQTIFHLLKNLLDQVKLLWQKMWNIQQQSPNVSRILTEQGGDVTAEKKSAQVDDNADTSVPASVNPQEKNVKVDGDNKIVIPIVFKVEPNKTVNMRPDEDDLVERSEVSNCDDSYDIVDAEEEEDNDEDNNRNVSRDLILDANNNDAKSTVERCQCNMNDGQVEMPLNVEAHLMETTNYESSNKKTDIINYDDDDDHDDSTNQKTIVFNQNDDALDTEQDAQVCQDDADTAAVRKSDEKTSERIADETVSEIEQFNRGFQMDDSTGQVDPLHDKIHAIRSTNSKLTRRRVQGAKGLKRASPTTDHQTNNGPTTKNPNSSITKTLS